MVDAGHFFTIFSVVLVSFSLALTELFWYYSTPQGSSLECNKEANATTCKNVFSDITTSFFGLFWSLFGHIDLSAIPYSGQLVFAYWVGVVLLGIFHLFAIIILINMLIAMMARSFDATSENREVEWKFHRTAVWITYIQRDFTRPSPMNLLPNPYDFYRLLRQFFEWVVFWCRRKFVSRICRPQNDLKTEERFERSEQTRRESRFVIKKNVRDRLLETVESTLVKRYKFGKLLKDA